MGEALLGEAGLGPETLFLFRLDTMLETLPPPGALGPRVILGPRTPADPVRVIGLLAGAAEESSGGDGVLDLDRAGDVLPGPSLGGDVTTPGLGISESSGGGSTNLGMGGAASSSSSGGGSLKVGRGGRSSSSGGGSLKAGLAGTSESTAGGGGGGTTGGVGGGATTSGFSDFSKGAGGGGAGAETSAGGGVGTLGTGRGSSGDFKDFGCGAWAAC